MKRKKIPVSAKKATQFFRSFIAGLFLSAFGVALYTYSFNPLYLVFVICGAIILVRFMFRNKVLQLNLLYNSIVANINALHNIKEELPEGLEARAKIKGHSIPDLQQFYSRRIQSIKSRALEKAKRNLESIMKLDPDFPYLKELKEELSGFSNEYEEK